MRTSCDRRHRSDWRHRCVQLLDGDNCHGDDQLGSGHGDRIVPEGGQRCSAVAFARRTKNLLIGPVGVPGWQSHLLSQHGRRQDSHGDSLRRPAVSQIQGRSVKGMKGGPARGLLLFVLARPVAAPFASAAAARPSSGALGNTLARRRQRRSAVRTQMSLGRRPMTGSSWGCDRRANRDGE